MLTRRAQGGERLLLLLLDGDENPLVLGARALVLGRFRGHVRRSEILQLDVVKRTAPAVFWLNAALNRVSWRTLIRTEFRSHMLTEEALVVSCCSGKSPGKMPISKFFIAKFHLTGYHGQLLVGEGASWLTAPRVKSRGQLLSASVGHG